MYVPIVTANQPSRNINGVTSSPVSFQSSAQSFKPEVQQIAKHIQNIWATCKFTVFGFL